MNMRTVRKLWGSNGGRALLVMWSAAFAVVILTQGFGVGPGDALFNFYFGFVPLFVLNNAAVIVSNFVRSGSERPAKIIWVAQCVLFLGLCIYLRSVNPDQVGSDARLLVLYIMGLAAFPASIPFGILFAGIDLLLGRAVPVLHSRAPWFVMDWSVFFAAGYLQWFKLLPYLMNRWQRRPSSRERG